MCNGNKSSAPPCPSCCSPCCMPCSLYYPVPICLPPPVMIPCTPCQPCCPPCCPPC
ncbi:hypothetical protein CBL_09901 [Carabus blaptoides fortunei]